MRLNIQNHLLFSLWVVCLFFNGLSSALANTNPTNNMRIVTMSPHLTELVFALGLGDSLVAVSDHSDYPVQATSLPSVVGYQGANLEAILRLRPTHILAWKGGNKDSDIDKLVSSGVSLYSSEITDISSLMDETRNIAKFLNIDSIGAAQAHEMELVIKALQNRFKGRSRSIIYLIGLNPLRALGNDPWLNNLLSLCGLTNAMQDSVAPYPQISMAQILRAQPNIVIVGTKLSQHEVQNTLAPPIIDLDTQILVANPDKLHRFTPRALDELAQLCTATYTTN